MSGKEDKQIVRFLNLGAAISVFRHSDFSTFRLGDTGEYIDIEDTAIQDKQEGQERLKYYTTVENSSLISCWCQMDTKEPSSEQWNLFDKSKVAAIVSSTEKVNKFLNDKLVNKFNQFFEVDHQQVEYYNLGENGYPANFDQVVFKKDNKFADEKEYRFAIRVYGGRQIRNITFYTGHWKDFGEDAYLRPDICDQDLQELLACVIKERNSSPIKALNIFKNSKHFEKRIQRDDFLSSFSKLL